MLHTRGRRLQPNETLTREEYVACVQNAAETLRKGGFFSDKTAAWFVEQAKSAELTPKSGTQ